MGPLLRLCTATGQQRGHHCQAWQRVEGDGWGRAVFGVWPPVAIGGGGGGRMKSASHRRLESLHGKCCTSHLTPSAPCLGPGAGLPGHHGMTIPGHAHPADAELAAFHREVQVLASLRHRNLVQARGGIETQPGTPASLTCFQSPGLRQPDELELPASARPGTLPFACATRTASLPCEPQFYGACLEPGSLMIVTELMKGEPACLGDPGSTVGLAAQD